MEKNTNAEIEANIRVLANSYYARGSISYDEVRGAKLAS